MPALPSQIDSLRDDARGSGSLLAHQQLGVFALGTEPSDGDTYTFDVNGTNVVITAKTVLGASADQVIIGGSALSFARNVYWGLCIHPEKCSSSFLQQSFG